MSEEEKQKVLADIPNGYRFMEHDIVGDTVYFIFAKGRDGLFIPARLK